MMTNRTHTVVYTGVTNNLERRVNDHKGKQSGFTAKYNVTKLVYFEECSDIRSAIAREKQIKAGSRQKKVDLINAFNPEWNNLPLS